MTARAAQPDRRSPSLRGGALRSFTLMELLVVMGIIALLAGITALAYRAVAKDAKLSSARNTIMAVLDNARSLAMRNNEIVVVAFRPRLDGREQYVEAVLAKWTRQSVRYVVNFAGGPGVQVIDRYVPLPNVEPRRLPQGIQIAGPFYANSLDDQWLTLSFFPGMDSNYQGEVPGAVLGVMFSPSGRNIMYNAKSDAQRVWIDFDNDNFMQFDGTPIDFNVAMAVAMHDAMFEHHRQDDEPAVSMVPFLAVIDDVQVRELYDVSQWNMLVVGSQQAIANRRANYTEYINNNADRIHFNRYTGVAMK